MLEKDRHAPWKQRRTAHRIKIILRELRRKSGAGIFLPESRALNGFIDGVFDYDIMNDRMLKDANRDKSPSK
jgi:hypothetical protein